MKTNKKDSYTSAEALPIKLINNEEVKKHIGACSKILPIHAQFIPTNKCNLNCEFCSCSEVDRTKEMSMQDAFDLIDKLKALGTKAVTITGGGEPLMHPHINNILHYFNFMGIKIGMVSNGFLLNKLSMLGSLGITWCRISNGDDREFTQSYSEMLSNVVTNHPHIDWAFSHVTSPNPNYDEIEKVVTFANAHNFTHVRLVADLFRPEEVGMNKVKEELKKRGVDDSLVIYQGRQEPKRGGDCYIGYLKPLISADCKVYACCGVQYAFDVPSKDLPEELCLGSAFDLQSIYDNSATPIDGRICSKCYYTNYNEVLKAMLSNIEHGDFL